VRGAFELRALSYQVAALKAAGKKGGEEMTVTEQDQQRTLVWLLAGVFISLAVIAVVLLIGALSDRQPGYDKVEQASCALRGGTYTWNDGAEMWFCEDPDF
jgi:hypothetical protein